MFEKINYSLHLYSVLNANYIFIFYCLFILLMTLINIYIYIYLIIFVLISSFELKLNFATKEGLVLILKKEDGGFGPKISEVWVGCGQCWLKA